MQTKEQREVDKRRMLDKLQILRNHVAVGHTMRIDFWSHILDILEYLVTRGS